MTKDSLQIKIINQKIVGLQTSLDSIKNNSTLKQLEYELHQKEDVIFKINEFYDSAWLKLIIVITILGVLLPIIAQYFQRQNLKDLTEFIRKQMNDNFDSKIEELKNFNKSEIEKALNEFKESIVQIENKNKNLLSQLDANTFFLQGRSFLVEKRYPVAVGSLIKSASLWLDSDRPDRSEISFLNILYALKKITKADHLSDIDNELIKSSLNSTFDELLKMFSNHELKHFYDSTLSKIIEEVERLKGEKL